MTNNPINWIVTVTKPNGTKVVVDKHTQLFNPRSAR